MFLKGDLMGKDLGMGDQALALAFTGCSEQAQSPLSSWAAGAGSWGAG